LREQIQDEIPAMRHEFTRRTSTHPSRGALIAGLHDLVKLKNKFPGIKTA
jgi:hypothetical protein